VAVVVPTVMHQSISSALGLISSRWLELCWWRIPPPAAERQHVVQSLETRLAILCGGPERCSFEGALASVAISTAPVAGDFDTVLGGGGR